MNYEEEVKSLFDCPNIVEIKGFPDYADMRAWLRQHDARLIRELAAMPKHQWDSYEEGRIDAWLELRADEIESEIGEKP